MSSRNVRLTQDDRHKALSISSSLRAAADAAAGGERNTETLQTGITAAITAAGGKVDYVEVVRQDTLQPLPLLDAPAVILVAARFGAVRLLDNWELLPVAEPAGEDAA